MDFKPYMDDEFLDKHGVAGYYRLRPTRIKYIDLNSTPQFEWVEYKHNQRTDGREFIRAVIATLRIWARAIRAPFFTATVIPVLLGATLAYKHVSVF